MRVKIAICDDDSLDREYIIGFLKKWSDERKIILQIVAFASAEQFLFQYAEEKDYDLLILDIEMGAMDGVTLAKMIRAKNEQIQILFITGYPDFMSYGYDVDAIHYLLKPVEYEKVSRVFDKVVRNLEQNEEVLFLQLNHEMARFVLSEINYIEVLAHSCTIHTIHGDFATKTSITELEKRLGNGFIRTHRSYLVNLEKVKRITKTDVVLDDETKVMLSRRNYTLVNHAFIDYFSGRQGEI